MKVDFEGVVNNAINKVFPAPLLLAVPLVLVSACVDNYKIFAVR
jgi:hypothetical protein